jgi:hypothetical protein
MLNEETPERSWSNIEQRLSHPFGSFRHYGAFAASLIAGSVTSRHLRAASIDFQSHASSNERADSVDEPSTHLYINMIDRSKVVKSMEIWTESENGSDTSVGGRSEFSSIHSEYDAMLDDFFLADHRAGDECWKCEVVTDPIKVSLSDKTKDGDESRTVPVVMKCVPSTLGKSKHCHRDVESNVVNWLQQLDEENVMTSPSQKRHLTTSPTFSNIKELALYGSTLNLSNSLSSDFENGNSGLSSTTTDDDHRTSNHWRESGTTFTVIHSQYSINTDAASFTNRPLITYGVTGRKFIPSKKEQFSKKIRKLGNIFKRKNRTKDGKDL